MNLNIEKADPAALRSLQSKWLDTLLSPQDGMWASIRGHSNHWKVTYGSISIAYACVNEGNLLLQFYILPQYLVHGPFIFDQFLKEQKIKKALVGTHNPQFLSLALHFVKELKIHTYLFRESLDVSIEEKKGAFSPANSIDLEQIVDFGQLSTGGNKEWLRGYFAKLIEKGALFQLTAKGQIIGTCEVRKSITHPAHADIGMIVSPEFRGQGYGTFLLNKAKTIAQEWGRIPICSCEKDNPASFQAISHCGFRSNFQLLEISFD